MDRTELELYLNNLLEASRFTDYCPNGVQVQGRAEIRKIATGVTASLALVNAALEWGADALLVHHGYFWKNEAAPIVGQKYRRLRALLAHDVNLFAYHLPLDAHPTLGNNAQLGARLGWQGDGRFGRDGLGWTATLAAPRSARALADEVAAVLGRAPLLLGDPARTVRRVAWCTGAAQSYFDAALDAGADLYLSGEVAESTTHTARERDAVYLGAGHHATERYGVQAIGTHVADCFGLEHRFIDIDNPV